MSAPVPLGALLEAFVNRVSHPRGRTLGVLAAASVTVSQAVLLDLAMGASDSTASSLATRMQMSLPSVSQMIERLVKLGFARRVEDPADRRRRTVRVTAAARTFLKRLKAVSSADYAAATAKLSKSTRRDLADTLARALSELTAPTHPPRR